MEEKNYVSALIIIVQTSSHRHWSRNSVSVTAQSRKTCFTNMSYNHFCMQGVQHVEISAVLSLHAKAKLDEVNSRKPPGGGADVKTATSKQRQG